MILYTAISNKMSALGGECLRMFHLARMARRCPTLLNAKGLELFYAMLEKHGIDEVYYYKEKTSFEKHYGYFITR